MKTKTIVLSFNFHLNKLQTKIKMRLKNTGHSQEIKIICDKMTWHLPGAKKWPTRQNFISKQKKMIWMKKLMVKCQKKMMLIKIYKSWINHTRKQKTIKNKSWKMISIKKRFLCTKFMNDWTAHWMTYENQLTYSTPAQTKGLKKSKMKWHVELMKMKNNLITQMWIEKIEFAKFLCVCKILKFDYSYCFYEVSKQTSNHVMMKCFLMSKKNKIWWTMSDAAKSYRRLMIIFKTTKTLTRWFIKTNLLSMFSLAKN